MQRNIHPTAIIESGAELGDNVTVEAYAIVKKHVVLEEGVTIKSHAYIDGYTRIGKNSTIWPSASIGTKTQDLKYKGDKTFLFIGENCEIREFATINSSTVEGTSVRVGNNCLIMIGCHIAHDCEIGNHVIMSNNAILAGHVTVEDYAIIGGMTPIHQFTRIGAHAMVGGLSRVTHDVPPFTVGGGIPFSLGGLNRVGMKRRGFSFEVRCALAKAYHYLYRSALPLPLALEMIENEVDSFPEVNHLIQFCKSSKRGLIGMQGIRHRTNKEEEILMEEKMENDIFLETIS